MHGMTAYSMGTITCAEDCAEKCLRQWDSFTAAILLFGSENPLSGIHPLQCGIHFNMLSSLFRVLKVLEELLASLGLKEKMYV